MKKLSNKATVVLNWLREHEGEHSCKDIAAAVQNETTCSKCNGTGDAGDGHPNGCSACYGRGKRYFGYSDAYVCLGQLRMRGLVERRKVLDEWGDETPSWVYYAVPVASATSDQSDELEELWNLPPAQRNS